MDGGVVRSRSSQSQSPSHSASASASVSASASLSVSTASAHNHHKRKFHSASGPFPSPLAADELDSASPREDEEEDTEDDDEDEDDIEDDEDEEDEDQDSMRVFNASRFENPPTAQAAPAAAGRGTKPPKPEPGLSTVKIEQSSASASITAEVREERGATGQQLPAGNIPGIVVKEEPGKGIYTDNIQTSGAYSAREEGLKREEDAGRLKFLCTANDGIDEHMIWLIGLKNIFARQLPNMPKEYIVRLVMDRSHKSMMVIRNNQVVGGITYRPYISQRFGEIAFCAITADEQVKGYGTRLMNHLKQHARDVDGLTHFLTYADNNAVGYFIKQGFSKEIMFEKDRWQGYIKDYDGGILMECMIDPKLPYTDLSTMIRRQRQVIDEKIRELSKCHIVYPGIDFLKKDGIPRKSIKVDDIPGLREAGWTPDQWGHTRYKTSNTSDGITSRQQLVVYLRGILKLLQEHPDAWPFRDPVDSRDVPDYYLIIKDPVDLRTMSKRLESEMYYVTVDMFIADVKRMFSNARTYNSPETIYYKCSTRLETFFSNKVQSLFSPK